MGLLDNESIPRRKMTLFFVIDTSGSMVGSKIGSVNDAIENVLPMIGEISDENPDAEINVAALEFSTVHIGFMMSQRRPRNLYGKRWKPTGSPLLARHVRS